jgi:hypothetical protein
MPQKVLKTGPSDVISTQLIFLLTLEWAQEVQVYLTVKPFQSSEMERFSLLRQMKCNEENKVL